MQIYSAVQELSPLSYLMIKYREIIQVYDNASLLHKSKHKVFLCACVPSCYNINMIDVILIVPFYKRLHWKSF